LIFFLIAIAITFAVLHSMFGRFPNNSFLHIAPVAKWNPRLFGRGFVAVMESSQERLSRFYHGDVRNFPVIAGHARVSIALLSLTTAGISGHCQVFVVTNPENVPFPPFALETQCLRGLSATTTRKVSQKDHGRN